MFAIIGILAIAGAVAFVVADDSSAASFDLQPSGDDYGKTGSSITYDLEYSVDNSSAKYKAILVDGNNNDVNATISSSTGSLYDKGSREFNITLPKNAGDYRLKVTITDGDKEYVRYAYVRAVEAVTLSATVENTGDASRSFAVYFYLKDGSNWNRLDDSKQDITIGAGESRTITYDYVVRDLSSQTFCIMADDSSTVGAAIQGLGPEHAHAFYTSEKSYTLFEVIAVVVLIILAIIAIWVYRKPVRNFGKPKGRR